VNEREKATPQNNVLFNVILFTTQYYNHDYIYFYSLFANETNRLIIIIIMIVLYTNNLLTMSFLCFELLIRKKKLIKHRNTKKNQHVYHNG
jgi:hypothetical protein